MLDSIKRLDHLERNLDRWLPKKVKATYGSLPSPQPGPQQQFYDSTADIVIYGGAAGSGKTAGLLIDFARHIGDPNYGAVILRRTYPEISNEGGLWDESLKMYMSIGGSPKLSDLTWGFPSGSSVSFGHLQHETDKYKYQGAQFGRLGIDEITHFKGSQFWYLLSRVRSTSGIPPQVRATCNPDPDSFLVCGIEGDATTWGEGLISWWIGSDGFPIPERSGVVRWFVRPGSDLVWADDAETLKQLHPDHPPKSLTFISAKLSDNPALVSKDPGYLGNLMALHPTDRSRLLEGNWLVRDEAGKFLPRQWIPVIDTLPQGSFTEVRFWDLAATEQELASKDPCYTAGCKMRRYTLPSGSPLFVIVDGIAELVGPAEGDTLLVNTASQDGRACRVRWEREGGSSGKRDARHITSMLAGYDAEGIRPQGDKVTRAKPLASQAKNGNVVMLRGDWNERWLNWLHRFPGNPKDPMDATSGAFNELTDVGSRRRGKTGSVTSW